MFTIDPSFDQGLVQMHIGECQGRVFREWLTVPGETWWLSGANQVTEPASSVGRTAGDH